MRLNLSPEEVREKVTNGTRHLVAVGGMGNFSFPKLSEVTGLSAPTVYEQYKNKEALLVSCYFEIDAEIGAIIESAIRDVIPKIKTPKDVYYRSREIWNVYWNYLTADRKRTLYYWRFYNSEYYNAELHKMRRENYSSFISFIDVLDGILQVSERFDRVVLVNNIVDGTVAAAVKYLANIYSNNDLTVDTIYQMILNPVFLTLERQRQN